MDGGISPVELARLSALQTHAFSIMQRLPSQDGDEVGASATNFVFVHHAQKQDTRNARSGKGNSAKVRAQAARASANIRLETSRRRAGDRAGPCGRRVFAVNVANAPGNQDRNQVSAVSSQVRESSVTLRANMRVLGGSIPLPQVDAAALGHFLRRFSTGASMERPWIELVTAEAASPKTPGLASVALQANAIALCANDLKHAELRMHATGQYLFALRRLQTLLKTPRWSDPDVLYTCMILTLYECIHLEDKSASIAHVKGVSQLFRQRGPQRFTSGLEHRAFRYYRINILMAALFDRQHTFLAETDWKTIPFGGDVPPKSILDLLIDILVDFPGVLGAIENLKRGDLGRYALMQQAVALVYWVRRLIFELEKWKVDHLWTYPAISTIPGRKSLDLFALCEHCTGLSPYDPSLVESLSCYCAAHLILARIAWGLSQRNFLIGFALHPPYSLDDLMQIIVTVSGKHVAANKASMISLIVTTFALRAVETTTEVKQPTLVKEARELIEQVNASFARRFNIDYTVSFD